MNKIPKEVKADIITLRKKTEPPVSYGKIQAMTGVLKQTAHRIVKRDDMKEGRMGGELMPSDYMTDLDMDESTKRMKGKIETLMDKSMDRAIENSEPEEDPQKAKDYAATAKNYAITASIMMDKKFMIEGKPQRDEEWTFRSKTKRDLKGTLERIDELIIKSKTKNNATTTEIP